MVKYKMCNFMEYLLDTTIFDVNKHLLIHVSIVA